MADSCSGRHGGADELAPKVAGEEVGGGDGHDGGGDQRADGDGGEAEAGEPLREHLEEEQGDGGVGVFGGDAGGEGDVAEQRDEAEQKAVGGKQRGVAADDVGALCAEDRGRGVGVEHQRDGGADGERGVAEVLRGLEEDGGAGCAGGERLVGGGEDVGVAAELVGKDDERGDDHEVEHDVLDDGDDGGGAQAARVGVGGEDDEGGGERPLAVDAHARR